MKIIESYLYTLYEFYFIAQNLNNMGNDPIYSGKTKITDTLKRQKISAEMGWIVNKGKKFTSGSVEVFIRGDKFLTHLIPKQLDVAGRLAPIVSIGTITKDKDFPRKVAKGLNSFAKQIGRSIDTSELRTLESMVTQVTQKRFLGIGMVKKVKERIKKSQKYIESNRKNISKLENYSKRRLYSSKLVQTIQKLKSQIKKEESIIDSLRKAIIRIRVKHGLIGGVAVAAAGGGVYVYKKLKEKKTKGEQK